MNHKIDVLLIKPDFDDIAVMPPLGLGYLASMLLKHKFSVRIHDNTLYRFNNAQLNALIKELNPKIVGISAVTPMIERAREIVLLVKNINKEILVVLGGPHPSHTIEECLEFADAIVIGEGEETFPKIVKKFLNHDNNFSEIEGCAYKGPDGAIVTTPPSQIITNLDSLAFPAFELMPIEQYMKTAVTFGILQKKSRSLPILASRGCPSDCIFCQRYLGKQFRIRSAENIVDELSFLKKQYHVDEFNFLDDNFTLHKKRVLQTCSLILKRNLKISFRFPNGVREDFLDEEILHALKSAGCYHLDFGIESGSQKVLDIMKKNKQINAIAQKVYLCHSKGFKLSASFLFGTPGETIDDIEKTIRFALSLPLDSATFGIVIPYPGTELRKMAIKNGYLIERPYRYYNPLHPDFKPLIQTSDWSSSDLSYLQKKAHRAFFLRPKLAARSLPVFLKMVNIKRGLALLRQLIKKDTPCCTQAARRMT